MRTDIGLPVPGICGTKSGACATTWRIRSSRLSCAGRSRYPGRYRTPSGSPAMMLIPRRLAAHLLDIRAARFRLETPFHRTLGRLRRLARRRWRFGGLEDQFLQPFPGILAITLLAAKTVGLDHQHTVL